MKITMSNLVTRFNTLKQQARKNFNAKTQRV